MQIKQENDWADQNGMWIERTVEANKIHAGSVTSEPKQKPSTHPRVKGFNSTVMKELGGLPPMGILVLAFSIHSDV